MAFLIEQAAGSAVTGTQSLLDIVPDTLHQKVPVILGSAQEVERVAQIRAPARHRDQQLRAGLLDRAAHGLQRAKYLVNVVVDAHDLGRKRGRNGNDRRRGSLANVGGSDLGRAAAELGKEICSTLNGDRPAPAPASNRPATRRARSR